MLVPEALERIVLVPRNGLGNRLQAWASATILAAQWDVPLKVMWEPETPAPAAPTELFSAEAISRSFVSREWLDDLLGIAHEGLPRYLQVDSSRRVVTLAGHDRGEQVFMAALPGALTNASEPHSLVIIAGGLFHIPSAEDFNRQRSLFYGALPWTKHLLERARLASSGHAPYCALHIRQTDRSLEAPPASVIRQALATMAERVAERSLFITADTAAGRSTWADEAPRLGYSPWSVADTEFDRTATSGAVSAAVDWILLAGATALAYPAASTFSAEAAVASGHGELCVPMSASRRRQQARAWGMHARHAVTYPSRHWRR